MSSAPAGHWLAWHSYASAAQGFSSGCPTWGVQTAMASAGTAPCLGLQTHSPSAARQLIARQDLAEVV